ncbi:hypothetical protein CROQUDRAFT_662084 [Cronartium quercuum f. sp. fusiforme G11]|uniref:Nuclear pore complex protein n=1 Tax=Cronartium quercuum f. sp. fusiforme G11 TaxID=708437 RepID=A0A9P6T8N5_9BASI|nr:hypothetical protein CROQUDRAFT_662084 [Cronartium quercuum f. sp. fusiforme G11]
MWKRVCEAKLDDHTIELSPDQTDAWKLERNTWQLVQMLYTERTSTLDLSNSKLPTNPYLPPLDVVNAYLPKSKDLLELSTIRDWLYTCPTSTHPTEIRRGYWPYTKAALRHASQKNQPISHVSSQTRIVHELDPDAPLRPISSQVILQSGHESNRIRDQDTVNNGQLRRLEQLDEEYDRAMIRTLYEYVRAGEIDLATDFCRQCDHHWRAASLSGGRLFHDPDLSQADMNYGSLPVDGIFNDNDSLDGNLRGSNTSPYGKMNRAGCLNRKLWKSICLQISLNQSLSTYEQALYGALSGQISSVLPVCYTWEDHIWCHINSIFENQVDKILESTEMGYYWTHGQLPPPKRKVRSEPKYLNSRLNEENFESESSDEDFEEGINEKQNSNDENIKVAMNKAFDKVLRSENVTLAESARNPFHVAQMWLAIDKINDLFTTFYNRLQSATEDFTTDHLSHLLRFFAHLILFLRSIDQKVDNEASNAIIRAYVQVLEIEKKHDLIAFYVAELQQESGVETYAKYLISLGPLADRQTRRTALLRAMEHGLDLSRVACTAVTMTLKDIQQAKLSSNRDHGLHWFTRELTEKQTELIRSLEWLTIDQTTYFDALVQANSLIRYFLSSGHPNAARQVLGSLPPDLLGCVANEDVSQENKDGEDLPERSSSASTEILEFTQYQDFFNCLELHVEVNEVLSHRPVEGCGAVELKEYTQVLDDLCTQLHTSIVNLLKLEWLQDTKLEKTLTTSNSEKDGTSKRVSELERIRKIYIPELVFRLHGALVDSSAFIVQNLRRALDLASVVADETYKNYLEFLTDRQQESIKNENGINVEGGGTKNKMKEYLKEIRQVNLLILKVSSGKNPLRV